MNLRSSILALLAILIGLGCAGAADNADAEKAAIAAAEAWLELVDRGDYGKSWSEAASYFKNAVDEATWEQQMVAARKPLGESISRKVKGSKYATSLPGAPDGEYVVIQMETSFENKSSAVETITPMLDGDGRWRVSGYFIK